MRSTSEMSFIVMAPDPAVAVGVHHGAGPEVGECLLEDHPLAAAVQDVHALHAARAGAAGALEELEVRVPPGIGGKERVEVGEAEVGQPSPGRDGDCVREPTKASAAKPSRAVRKISFSAPTLVATTTASSLEEMLYGRAHRAPADAGEDGHHAVVHAPCARNPRGRFPRAPRSGSPRRR